MHVHLPSSILLLSCSPSVILFSTALIFLSHTTDIIPSISASPSHLPPFHFSLSAYTSPSLFFSSILFLSILLSILLSLSLSLSHTFSLHLSLYLSPHLHLFLSLVSPLSVNALARKSITVSTGLSSASAQPPFASCLSRSAPGSFISASQSEASCLSGKTNKSYQNAPQCLEGSTYPEPAPPVSRLCIHGVLSQGTEYFFELPPAALNKYIGRRVRTPSHVMLCCVST